MKNTAIQIGYTGCRTLYINVPLEEAVARFKKENSWFEHEEHQDLVTVFEFEDEMYTYEAGPVDGNAYLTLWKDFLNFKYRTES